jgi:hypothetical protein
MVAMLDMRNLPHATDLADRKRVLERQLNVARDGASCFLALQKEGSSWDMADTIDLDRATAIGFIEAQIRAVCQQLYNMGVKAEPDPVPSAEEIAGRGGCG